MEHISLVNFPLFHYPEQLFKNHLSFWLLSHSCSILLPSADNLASYFCDKLKAFRWWSLQCSTTSLSVLGTATVFSSAPLLCCFWPHFYQCRLPTNITGFHLLLPYVKLIAFGFHFFSFYFLELSYKHLILSGHSNLVIFLSEYYLSLLLYTVKKSKRVCYLYWLSHFLPAH